MFFSNNTPVKKTFGEIMQVFKTAQDELVEFINDRKQEAADYANIIAAAQTSKAEVEVEIRTAEKSLSQVEKFLQ